jgi:RNA polymerase sigma factor (sigma-70 family)
MSEDAELLRRYAKDHSEAAFAELILRHVDLVYSAAFRLMNGDSHRAQDVTQQVFAELARQAKRLTRHPALLGWLYTTTRHTALRVIRSEQRRIVREREAQTMNVLLHEPSSEPDWEQLRPVLEEAMHELDEKDRLAVLLRYFKNRSLKEVGLELGLNENSARMRVERALDKLRLKLARKGVTSTAAALALALAGNAVTAAPTGFVATLTTASLAVAAAGTGTTLTILNLMAMTKLQLGVTALALAGAATTLMVQHHAQVVVREENMSLRRQVAQLRTENESLSNRVSQVKSALTLSLPAPRLQRSTSPAYPAPDRFSTNLIARLQRGEKAPMLTPEQAEAYLKENHRNAASLLAAFRATGDLKLLDEATENYPNDPQVAFTAAYKPGVSPEEQRHWLDVFKQSAPENALPDYLSALNHFKAGQAEMAIEDLSAATGKQKFQDYSWDFIENGEEAYRAAGYPEVQARVIPSMALVLPHLAELKQLNGDLIDLAAAYRQAGDESSAQTALEMDAALGQRLRGPEGTPLITQLVGIAIESIALKQMNSNSLYGSNGQTVQARLDELTQQKNTLNQFANQLDDIYSTISAADWISYHDRWQAFGEENAIKWLLSKYSQK